MEPDQLILRGLHHIEAKMKTQEIVYTIEEFYDCPREGIAEYQGTPVYYTCLFDEEAEEWSSIYELRELADESLSKIFKQEGNWRDWSYVPQKKVLQAAGEGAEVQQSFILKEGERIRRKAVFIRFAKGCWNGYLVEWHPT